MDCTLNIALVKNGHFNVIAPDGRQRSYAKAELCKWLLQVAGRAGEGSRLQIKIPHGPAAHPEELQLWQEMQDDSQWETI